MPCGQSASVKLCQPRTEADGKPVTKSNLSLDPPREFLWSFSGDAVRRT